jgi:hypothetical protein
MLYKSTRKLYWMHEALQIYTVNNTFYKKKQPKTGTDQDHKRFHGEPTKHNFRTVITSNRKNEIALIINIMINIITYLPVTDY